jgi:hypothetical protein
VTTSHNSMRYESHLPKKRNALERWSNGLLVMLKKMFGVRLVSKLQAILLMAVDFNAMNK